MNTKTKTKTKTKTETRTKTTPTARGEDTRRRILAVALAHFRKRGFDKTTMREIADAAGMALGAAYYYFPSKDALVLAYYEETQRKADEQAAKVFSETKDVRERLGAAMHARFDVLSADRRLLSGLFRSVAEPDAPISVFSPETAAVRAQSLRMFDEALEPSEVAPLLDPTARKVLVLALWSLQMGLILYFIHDRSPKQQKTRALADAALDLVVELLPMAPMLGPMFGDRIGAILKDAELLR